MGVRPSAKKVRRLCAELRGQTSPRWQWLEPEEMAGRLNAQLRGWAGYFCLGTVTKAYRQVTAYTCDRLRQWLARKYKVQGSKRARFSDRYLHERLGLLRLQRRPANAAWANA